ncbi:hypothetical protein DMN91_006681 [Ooceraea biroi]|uniref:Uncharacterized protein n=1 Tax=Ooceraea biroi TaxID=2015173 RepID=A0A026WFD2_OOCBI|nr:uncharacterized protein LOC105279696 [Ooceraea biroi]XP_011337929.1 uncharacterized protein LOC105279696 [Ooceraea biroi]XP_011337930.1 uncharacterized protein LOC105279696 [Ooceraea biroi]EZA54623.1 hypothetical protein X777_04908 [Ooceraea biroi]RLU20075.1 hypothetical protein DMN91_006681 [Ooceraea biroi]
MASLEDSWKEATQDLNAAVCDSWFTRLQEVYSEEKRTYHNLDSLREKLNHYYEIKSNLKNPRAVLLAIFFQNFEYDPKALDGEDKNLEHFNAFADEVEIPSDAELREETCSLLKVAATHSTEAHKVGGAFGGEDAHYFLDLDMAVLGSSPDTYAEYRERIRGEYSFLSEPMYTALRLKVLQNFLQIPNIFATMEFRDKLEEQARQNIEAEVELLS